jgi:hypothetical protein
MDKPWSEGGQRIAALELPEVPRNQEQIGSIGFLFTPDEPAERTCGYALVLVFAVGGDEPSLPASTTAPACFGQGTISFADAGDGSAGGDGAAANVRLALVLVGSLFAAGGITLGLLRRVRRSGRTHGA